MGALDGVLMIWQNGCAVLLAVAFTTFADLLPQSVGQIMRMHPIRAHQVRRLFLPSVNFVLMLLCSLRALRYVHIATVVVARNVATCFVAGAEKVVFDKSLAVRPFLALLITILGSLVYAYNDLMFHPSGYLWQGLNTGLFVIGQIYEKWAMTKTHDQTPLGVSVVKNLWSLPISVGIMVFSVGSGLDVSAIHVALIDAQQSSLCLCLIVLSGLGCFCMSVCYMTLYSLSSATSITVAANVNKVVTIVAARWLFRDVMGTSQMVGLAICLSGSAWYSMEICAPSRPPQANGHTNGVAAAKQTDHGLRRR